MLRKSSSPGSGATSSELGRQMAREACSKSSWRLKNTCGTIENQLKTSEKQQKRLNIMQKACKTVLNFSVSKVKRKALATEELTVLALQDGHLDRRTRGPLLPEQRLSRAGAEERGPRGT